MLLKIQYPNQGSVHLENLIWTMNLSHYTKLNYRTVWISEGRPRGMEHESYKTYKQSKRVFSKELTLKELEYEQNKLGELQKSEDVDIRKFWRYIRSHKDSIQIYACAKPKRKHFELSPIIANHSFIRHRTTWTMGIWTYQMLVVLLIW